MFAGQRQSLAKPHSRTVEQQEDRAVAQPGPLLTPLLADPLGEMDRFVGRDRAGEGALDPRSAQARGLRVADPGLGARKSEEGAQGGELARGGPVGQAIGAAAGELGAQGRGFKLRNRLPVGRIRLLQQPLGGADVCTHGVGRQAALARKVAFPAGEQATHAATRCAGTSSASSASSSGMPCGVIVSRSPSSSTKPRSA